MNSGKKETRVHEAWFISNIVRKNRSPEQPPESLQVITGFADCMASVVIYP
jgi:hypothetical protein